MDIKVHRKTSRNRTRRWNIDDNRRRYNFFCNVGEAEGVIEEDEKEMIHSIVGFGETSAKEVMTPRTAMLAFEGNKTIRYLVWNGG